MPSKQVTDRQKSATAVIFAGEAHADRIGGELDAQLSPYLRKGEKMPDAALFARLVTRALADARDTLVAADEAHLAEFADDGPPREARDEAASALYGELTDLREWLTGLYGGAAAQRLGFSDVTPRDPVQLERFAGEVARPGASPGASPTVAIAPGASPGASPTVAMVLVNFDGEWSSLRFRRGDGRSRRVGSGQK